jgi:hypothetical protein
MVDRRPEPHVSRVLFVVALTCGVLVGGSVVGASALMRSPSSLYWASEASVPSSANESTPYVVSFHGATFSMWWPDLPPGAYSGVPGVSIHIAEPSGAVDQTETGCGACGFDQHMWYSNDGEVGISWYDPSEGHVTLLVRA